MMKFSTSLVIEKLQIKTSMRYYFIIIKMTKIKMTGIAKVDKDVEKQELSCMAGESIKQQISVEKDQVV